MAIAIDRKNWKFRLLEGFIGITTITFILGLVALAYFQPIALAVFLIVYSFFVVLKSALHTIYTIYTFKNIYRYEQLNWNNLIALMSKSPDQAKQELQKISDLYSDKLNWGNEWGSNLSNYELNVGTKFQDPLSFQHLVFIPIFNESKRVMISSIERLYNSGFPLNNFWVVVAREAGAGIEYNNSLADAIKELEYVEVIDCDEFDIDNLEQFNNTTNNKIKVFLTLHPDQIEGEIRGKGSNLNWAGRCITKYTDKLGFDDQTTIVTVLDCDSKPGKNFFQILSFRYAITQDRLTSGFQPIPVFTNNYFESTLLSSLVATGTTLWNFVQTSIPEEIHHFANYSVSLQLLKQTDYWITDLVSEDSLFFKNNFCKLNGAYKSIPTFAYFESDVVESENFGLSILNQYKQLRRWAYGGVEGFSYFGKWLLLEESGKNIDNRKKFMMLYNEWVGHFFWATMPFVFGYVIFLPNLFNVNFSNSVIGNNLSFFSLWFSVISYVFLIINSFVITHFIHSRLMHRSVKMVWYNYLDMGLQMLLSPLIFVTWFLPPLEAQVRGVFGWYLGFWVTPKK